MKAFGKNVALEILKRNILVNKVYLAYNFSDKRIISLLEKYKNKINILDKLEIAKFDKYNHQGIILDIEEIQYHDVNNLAGDKIVVLDHIEDQHNLGAIIRTCEAAGIKDIIMPKDRAADITSTTIKTSAGTIFNMNIAKVTNLKREIDSLKERGYWIVGTHLGAKIDFKDVDYKGKIVLVIGNEAKGMSDNITKACDYLVKIPMKGETNSLNASVAAGIMIYEMIKE